MEVFLAIVIVFIIICLILIWFFWTYNNYQNLIIRINEVESRIDSTLRKRFDLLNKSINIIKANINEKGDVLEIIVKLRSRKLSNFELDRYLYDAINEFNNYIEKHKEINSNETIIKINSDLNKTEHEINAFRKYYNDNITKYNQLIKKFPTNLVGNILKYNEKLYFDGKNMSDDIINDFKL